MTGESLAARHTRAAYANHWDPYAIDVTADRDAVASLDRRTFTRFRGTLARFGAGEDAVTEDLVPLLSVLDGEDRIYAVTQIYDETRHAAFLERYWREVVTPVERDRGMDATDPTAAHWFSDAYEELFERTHEAMYRLRETTTPVARVRAYTHYHLTVEGILAHTAYYGIERNYGAGTAGLPLLTGLVDGFHWIRQDEGRHVAFGLKQVRRLVESDGVDPWVVAETIGELLVLVLDVLSEMAADAADVDGEQLQALARSTARDRIAQVADGDVTLPASCR
jgi:ribonucleoside-diphosphate reductase beta chain